MLCGFEMDCWLHRGNLFTAWKKGSKMYLRRHGLNSVYVGFKALERCACG